MDANIRFKLLLMLPSIRKVDHVVPLKIQRLEFNSYEFIVNETSYRLGIYRDYGELNVPGEHGRENENGGIDCDLDQYGFRDKEAVAATTPGDIVIRREDPANPEIEELTDEDIDEEELMVQVLAYVLALKRGEDVGAPPVDENHPLYQIILQEENDSYSNTESMHDHIQNDILPYVHRKAGRLAPYKKFAKWNVTGQWSLSYDFEENSKLHVVQKNITDLLFGHRSLVMSVNQLVVNPNSNDYTIRLPPGLKVRIRKLSLGPNDFAVYQAIQSIIDLSSYPLEVATLQEYFEDPHVRSARRLELHVLSGFDVLLTVSSREIASRFTNLAVHDYVRLVEHLLNQPTETGTCWRFGQYQFDKSENILRAMEARFEKEKIEERRVTIASENHGQQIVVWYEYTRDPIYGIDWTLVVKVEDYRD